MPGWVSSRQGCSGTTLLACYASVTMHDLAPSTVLNKKLFPELRRPALGPTESWKDFWSLLSLPTAPSMFSPT